MTALEKTAMDEDAPRIGGRLGRVLLIALAALWAIFGAGMIVGILAKAAETGGAVDLRLIALLGGAGLFTAAGVWACVRATTAYARAAGAATSRERRHRIVMAACIAVGLAIGMALAFAEPTLLGVFSSAPLPATAALALAFLVVIPLPILSWYWHNRVADEQEANAYRQGALIGIYTFWIGAPAWWLLWRGGIVPPPDGIILYLLTILVATAIWLWVKYR